MKPEQVSDIWLLKFPEKKREPSGAKQYRMKNIKN